MTMINDCWNKIGVRGDGSCSQLPLHTSCRNCPTYSAAAVSILDRAVLGEQVVQSKPGGTEGPVAIELDTRSVVVFRIGAEWLALATSVFREVAAVRTIHSLPQRRAGAVLGLANVRGELLVCLSLARILGIECAESPQTAHPRATDNRLLVMQQGGHLAVCPVDEVFGVERFHKRDLRPVPAILSRSGATYTSAALSWRQKLVALLDHELLFHTLTRSLASAT
jgi:chemotaxis-related protein WspD